MDEDDGLEKVVRYGAGGEKAEDASVEGDACAKPPYAKVCSDFWSTL